MRSATIERTSNETKISLHLNLDGTGTVQADTGVGMLEHLLTLTSFWAGFDLRLSCQGDLHIDAHHSIEDVGLCFGQALLEAQGDRKGIRRMGMAKVPMDEALVEVVVDLSGRPWLEWRGEEILPPVIASEERDVWRELYKSIAFAAHCNIHIVFHYGKNGHHLIEAAAKALGLALAQALEVKGQRMPSTKGMVDA